MSCLKVPREPAALLSVAVNHLVRPSQATNRYGVNTLRGMRKGRAECGVKSMDTAQVKNSVQRRERLSPHQSQDETPSLAAASPGAVAAASPGAVAVQEPRVGSSLGLFFFAASRAMSQAAKAVATTAVNPGTDGKGKGTPSTGPAPAPGPASLPASVPKPVAKVGDLPPGSYRVRMQGPH